ncbi:9974_t:CDS:2 [Ambispora leptoticha]|uniref:9974_t:CDS:1 n=1 Tax=Ambispora leptoticha TaxID=144679 RepID=A0A9N8ZQK5_9GLOM|nr:9974_t:CDS:2 [Ambispora leptoticha]
MENSAKHFIFSNISINRLFLTAKFLSVPEVTVEEKTKLTEKATILWRYDGTGRIISEDNGKALAVKDLLEPNVEVAPSWHYDDNTSVISCVGYIGALTVAQALTKARNENVPPFALTVVKDENDQHYLRLESYDNNDPKATQRFTVIVAPSSNI